MDSITKVIFTPKPKSPVNCKNVEYFVDTGDWSEAIEIATDKFKVDDPLWHYYRDTIATTIKVL